MDQHPLKHIIEAALLTAGKPLSMQHLQQLLADDAETPLAKEFVQAGLDALSYDLEDRGIELKRVASGYRLQVRQSLEPWIARLFEERPPRYSRALLETLALIGYRQPITRAEIEDVRGVSVSTNIIRTLLEREWIKVVGHRDVPGRPSMYGTTKKFLDYFNLESLSQLPELGELMDIEKATEEFDKANGTEAANDGESEQGEETDAEQKPEEPVAAVASDATPEQQSSEQTTDSSTADGAEETKTELESVAPNPSEEPQELEVDTGRHEPIEASQAIDVEDGDATPSVDTTEDTELDDGESQEDIDADVESLIRMLDAEVGATAAPQLPDEPPTGEQDSTPDASVNLQHEAARGESITPAELLRRHSTDTES